MTGRRWLVTGAASGIGRATALLVARREPGASLALVDVDVAGLAETARQAAGLGADCVEIVVSLATPEGPVRAVERTLERFGGLDVVVSIAGGTRQSTLRDLSVEDWDWSLDLNTRATWLLARTAADALAASGGCVVATTSISGQHATVNAGAYSVSKAALEMLVRLLALELGPTGVRVNCVAPGPTDTPLTYASMGDPDNEGARRLRREREAATPLRRIGAADDVAETIHFLAGPAASHITGQELTVDGGLGISLLSRNRAPYQEPTPG